MADIRADTDMSDSPMTEVKYRSVSSPEVVHVSVRLVEMNRMVHVESIS